LKRTQRDEDRVEINVHFSLKILDTIKDVVKKSKDASLKSEIYHMFSYLINSNIKLAQPIQSILLKQVNYYFTTFLIN
jgi:hypothetical protein